MSERIPLVYNPSADQIQEVATTDELSVGIITAAAFSNLATITQPVSLANSHFNYMQVGPIAVSGLGTITVGAGVSYVVI